MNPVSRRQFLALGATVVIAGCSSGDGAATDTPTVPPTDDANPGTTAAPTTGTASPSTAASTTAPPGTEPPSTEPATTEPAVTFDHDPFTMGVASGDPDATSVVLWTRLTAGSDSDLPDEIDVEWEMLDADQVIASGVETTSSGVGHSIHVVAPIDRPLTYRFRAGGQDSPTGRTQPATGGDQLRIAAATCQHFETGYYAAHRDIAEWSPDLVVFLGDFIYEGAGNTVGDAIVRSHDSPEPKDLGGYRDRYARYLSDSFLRAARATCPWMVIWDDHEVENNYAGLTPENPDDAHGFAQRRAEAYQAWWEHTPTRLPAPSGTARYEIYRGADFGDLARISVLDGRQFRDDQECGSPVLSADPPCAEVAASERTMLGGEQEAWLLEQFASSTATWNVVGQQTVLTDVRLPNGAILNYDQWDGYPAARDRLLAGAPGNLVVLTGDIHLAGVGSLGGAGAEFVSTSISSVANVDPVLEGFVRDLPGIVDAELFHRGYIRHVVTPAAWTAEYRIVDDIADQDSTVSTWKTFQVTAGDPTPTELNA